MKLTKETFKKFREDLFVELNELIEQKNADYTAGSSVFANFEICEEIGIDRLHGLTIRFLDKVQRLKSYVKNGKLEVGDEGVEDVFKDFIGYSFLALGMLHEDQSIVGTRINHQKEKEEAEKRFRAEYFENPMMLEIKRQAAKNWNDRHAALLAAREKLAVRYTRDGISNTIADALNQMLGDVNEKNPFST